MMDMNDLLVEIENCIMDGDADRIATNIRIGLEQGIAANIIVKEALLIGMSKMGRLFRDNEVYIVDVMLAADAMRTGLNILKPMLSKGNPMLNRKIVLGTVQNDLHDLGKSIISCSFTAAGFDVIDLGVNIPAEKFIKALEKEIPCILALSCTLSYTLADLRKIVEEINKSPYRQRVKIIVGGLSVTQRFADSIGADAYALDAEHGVMVALRLIQELEAT